jgi:hypothetical protein
MRRTQRPTVSTLSTPTATTTKPSAPLIQPEQLSAPALNAGEPQRSYKVRWGKSDTWVTSEDGGKTNSDSGTNVVFGALTNIILEITPATGRRESDNDYRLRVQFTEANGDTCELNLNACNEGRSGTYVTMPARCIIGALIDACQSPDDMDSLCRCVRFTLVPGDKAGVFIDIASALIQDDEVSWIQHGGKDYWKLTPQTPFALVGALETCKQAFRQADLLEPGPAVIGEVPGLQTVEVLSSTLDQD